MVVLCSEVKKVEGLNSFVGKSWKFNSRHGKLKKLIDHETGAVNEIAEFDQDYRYGFRSYRHQNIWEDRGLPRDWVGLIHISYI